MKRSTFGATMKRVGAGVAAVATLVGMAACGSSSNGDDTSSKSSGPTEIEVWSWSTTGQQQADAFNKAHGITPQSVKKKVQDVIEITSNVPTSSKKNLRTKGERQQEIARLTRQMKEAAKMLEFEIAAQLRDQIKALEEGR